MNTALSSPSMMRLRRLGDGDRGVWDDPAWLKLLGESSGDSGDAAQPDGKGEAGSAQARMPLLFAHAQTSRLLADRLEAFLNGGPSNAFGVDTHPGEGGRAGRRLRRYWTHGEGAAKIQWGVPGDFDRCVVELGKYSEGGAAFDPKGLCARLHHEALGVWPGQEDGGRRGGHRGGSKTAERDAAKVKGSFNPEQLRDSDGKWSATGVIVRKALKLGGQEIGVSVHPDRSRTLDFPGGRSVRLESHEISGPYRQHHLHTLAYDSVDWRPGEGDALTRIHETSPGKVRSELVLGVKKVAEPPDIHPNGDPEEETWDLTPVSLHLPPNSDPSFDGLMNSEPVATMRQRDLVTLADMQIPATRVALSSGQSVDVFRDGGKFTIRPVGSDGMTLDSRGTKALYGAINELWDDEYRDPRPDNVTVEQVVSTKAGTVTVRMTGEATHTQIIGPGLQLDLDKNDVLDFQVALSDLVESARPSNTLLPGLASRVGSYRLWLNRIENGGFNADQFRDDQGRWALLEELSEDIDEAAEPDEPDDATGDDMDEPGDGAEQDADPFTVLSVDSLEVDGGVLQVAVFEDGDGSLLGQPGRAVAIRFDDDADEADEAGGIESPDDVDDCVVLAVDEVRQLAVVLSDAADMAEQDNEPQQEADIAGSVSNLAWLPRAGLSRIFKRDKDGKFAKVDELAEKVADVAEATPPTAKPIDLKVYGHRVDNAAVKEAALGAVSGFDLRAEHGDRIGRYPSSDVTAAFDSYVLPDSNVGHVYYPHGRDLSQDTHDNFGHDIVNGQLRAANGDLARVPQVRSQVERMDAAFEGSKATRDLFVMRTIHNPESMFGSRFSHDTDMAGVEWVDQGYTSTSANESRVWRTFGADGGVNLQILVPEGSPAVVLSGMEHDGEGEILLPRGSRFRVVHDWGYAPVGDVGDVRWLDVEVIPDEGV